MYKVSFVSRTRSPNEAISAPGFVHPRPRVGPMGRWVKPGHGFEFGRMATDQQVFVLCTDGAAEILVVALVTAATRGEKRKRDGRRMMRAERER